MTNKYIWAKIVEHPVLGQIVVTKAPLGVPEITMAIDCSLGRINLVMHMENVEGMDPATATDLNFDAVNRHTINLICEEAGIEIVGDDVQISKHTFNILNWDAGAETKQ